ncbi:TDT family transporter [Romboutsia sp.]|uniref:TDT family transporter n=1 Tax=Romboutsia sp. TaxID=1965302 RepID=UPI003F3F1693
MKVHKILNKDIYKNIPIAISGISLALMSITTAWVGVGSTFFRHFGVFFSLIALTLIITKALLHPKDTLSEIRHPFIGSFYPTIAMTIMVISTYVVEYSLIIGRCMWLFGIALHIILNLIFFVSRFKNFKFEDVVPSWYIVTVGLGVGAVTGRPMGYIQLSQILFYYAFIWYLVLLPIMVYRIVKVGHIPKTKKTSLMIMGAPANICLAGYLGVFDVKSNIIIGILLVLAVVNMLYDYYILPKLLRLPFSLALAPLTFPLSIGAVAMQRYSNYLTSINSPVSGFVSEIFFIQLIVATLVTGYIVYKLSELFLLNLNEYL